MFVQQFVKQLWAIIYNSYVPLQILNYCMILIVRRVWRGRFTAKTLITLRYSVRGPYASDSVRGGIGPSHLHTVSP